MKTRLFLIGLIVAAVCLSSCEPRNDVSANEEKNIINAVYQSLDLTPEHFGKNMVKQGLYEIPQYDFMADRYKTFATSEQRSDNTIIININFRNDTILQISYERSLNKKSNIATYYSLFSNMIADHGYSEWAGYYEDPDDKHNVSRLMHGGDDYGLAQTAENREDLLDHISNDRLSDVSTSQYFAEHFIYTHEERSQWEGQTLLWSSTYFSGEDEDSGQYFKDVSLSFILKRIE